MRKLFVIIFILLNISYAQVTSSLQAWENVLQTPELVEYFRGIFNYLGVTVEETGEEFTIQHTGDGLILKWELMRKRLILLYR